MNPAGGCLPILLQMPILFAFYNLLTAAVELRGAPWMLWIQDLAVQDPYYVLPIVMGLTQWLQVKMSPQAGDPMQRRMFELMPIFMTFLFLGFPSGLVLYWLTNNVLTIAAAAGLQPPERARGRRGLIEYERRIQETASFPATPCSRRWCRPPTTSTSSRGDRLPQHREEARFPEEPPRAC